MMNCISNILRSFNIGHSPLTGMAHIGQLWCLRMSFRLNCIFHRKWGSDTSSSWGGCIQCTTKYCPKERNCSPRCTWCKKRVMSIEHISEECTNRRCGCFNWGKCSKISYRRHIETLNSSRKNYFRCRASKNKDLNSSSSFPASRVSIIARRYWKQIDWVIALLTSTII